MQKLYVSPIQAGDVADYDYAFNCFVFLCLMSMLYIIQTRIKFPLLYFVKFHKLESFYFLYIIFIKIIVSFVMYPRN